MASIDQASLWDAQAEGEAQPIQKPLSQWAQLFEWGKQRGFPELDFPTGIIPKGEENWQKLFAAEQNPWVDSVGFTSEKWLSGAIEHAKRKEQS